MQHDKITLNESKPMDCLQCNSSAAAHASHPGIVENLVRQYRQWRQNRINRLAFQNLLSLEDDQLKDIGLSREEVESANRLPMRENAAQRLSELKTTRKQW